MDGSVQKKHLSLNSQYTILQSLYWMSNCIISGFAAVYLQYKGVSNTWIGIITGFGCLLVILVQPFVIWLVEKKRWFSIKGMLQFLMIIITIGIGILNFTPIPQPLIKWIYLLLFVMDCCIPALINAMGMEYINRGKSLNFSVSRGLGSLFYAIYAVPLGSLVEHYSPHLLGYFYIGSVVILLLNLWGMENAEKTESEEKTVPDQPKAEISLLRNNRFVCIVLAFFFIFAATRPVSTYMINIVRELGGNETVFGWGQFIANACEVPVMMLSGSLIKKLGCRRLLLTSIILYMVRSIIFVFSHNMLVFFAGLFIQAIAGGLHGTISVYYVNEIVPASCQVRAQSVYYMLAVIFSGGIGCILSGWILDSFHIQGMLIIVAVFSVIGFLLALPGIKNHTEQN